MALRALVCQQVVPVEDTHAQRQWLWRRLRAPRGACPRGAHSRGTFAAAAAPCHACTHPPLLTQIPPPRDDDGSNVQNYRWRKQLLFVWAFTHRDAMLIEKIYSQMPASLRANTVLLITRCDGANWIR